MNRLTLDADMQVDQTQRERLLRSLKFPAFNERGNQVSQAYRGTFEWIFLGDDGPSKEDLGEYGLDDSDWEDSDLEDLDLADPSEARWDLFSNWLCSTAEVYWISGKPGSGKTTLVKYVLDHPKTITYLNTWSPQVLIISHYFWRPGNLMQQNIKGLLCSLLYQLLEKSLVATKHVLRDIQARSLGTKDKDTDWSVPELQSIFLQTLSSYERPVCIFIDGLDEVHPSEGPDELLALIMQFRRRRQVKLCLSSRPEPILKDRLSAYPRLRVQDLTRSDLERYALDHIKLTESIFDEALRRWHKDSRNPVDILVDKAEGVFLWLILAVKSINKGFTHRDTAEMIWQRIHSLPGDLTRLYKDMWDRACEDNPVAYRERGALYFRLILLSQDEMIGGICQAFGTSSLLHLMLASTSVADQLLDAISSPPDLVSEERLLYICGECARQLNLYCFNLVETYPSCVEAEVFGWYDCHYDTLWLRYGRRHVQFIHRTAQEFLVDTVDGQEILNHDSTSESSLLLKWIRAHLAMTQLYAYTGKNYSTTFIVRHYIECLVTFRNRVPWPDSRDQARTISYLRALCDSGQVLHGWRSHARYCGGIEFLNVAAGIYDAQLISRSELSNLSIANLSQLLINVCEEVYFGNPRWAPIPKTWTEPLIMMLLSQGADPNLRGRNCIPWRDNIPGFAQVFTPFTQYLDTVLCKLSKLRRPPWTGTSIGSNAIAAILRILHSLLSHSANLCDQICLVGSYRAMPSLHINYEHFGIRWALDTWNSPDGHKTGEARNFLIFQYPARIILNALLDHLGTEIERSWDRNEMEDSELVSLLSRVRKHLDNLDTEEHGRVIGKLAYKEYKDPRDIDTGSEPLWYTPSEGCSSAIADELMPPLEKCLLNDFTFPSSTVVPDGRFEELIEKGTWNLQAEGLHNTCESLTELGILARVDFETHDAQGWVEKFRRRLFTNARLDDGRHPVSTG